jgi:metal-dependent HD superfamily phosphatase/phosphodiesterase
MTTTSPSHKTSPPRKINVPILGNKILEKVLEIINDNQEIHALRKVINVNAIDRLRMSDHGRSIFKL